jgi:hypothetical protein
LLIRTGAFETRDRLHPARCSSRKVVCVIWHVDLEFLPIDDVEIGLHPDIQRATIEQTNCMSGVTALHHYDILQGHLRATHAVAGPVCEKKCRRHTILKNGEVGTCIADARNDAISLEPHPHRLEISAAV